MKIVHCISIFDWDLLYRENYYASGLSRINNNSVFILTSNRGKHFANKYRLFPVGRFKEGAVTVIRQKPIFALGDMLYFSYKKIIDELNPDIVHVYEARQYITYLIARHCIRRKIPVVYEHEQRGLGSSLAGKIKSLILVNRWLKKIITKIYLIRVVTPAAKDYLLRYAKSVKNENIYLTTLAYDKDYYYFNQNLRSNFRKTLTIPDDTIAIGVTGKFLPIKKIEIIIESFKRAVQHKSNLMLIISGIGTNDYEDVIKSRISGHGKIIFNNMFLNRKALNSFYSGVDYVVWTSPTISFFEALGAGLKIIIPFGGATSHLQHENIIFYGKNKGIEWKETFINNPPCIIQELADIFSHLSNHFDRKPAVQFEKNNIVMKLNEQYRNIIDS